jgi:hypothetical protein
MDGNSTFYKENGSFFKHVFGKEVKGVFPGGEFIYDHQMGVGEVSYSFR